MAVLPVAPPVRPLRVMAVDDLATAIWPLEPPTEAVMVSTAPTRVAAALKVAGLALITAWTLAAVSAAVPAMLAWKPVAPELTRVIA